MKRILFAILTSIIILFFAACSSKAISDEPIVSPEPTVSNSTGAQVESNDDQKNEPPVSQETAVVPVLNTTGHVNSSFDITVTLDPSAHSLDVLQNLIYVNNTGEELYDVYFNLIPQAFSRDGSGVSMKKTTVLGTDCKLEKVDRTVYSLTLPSPLDFGESIEITMQYTVDIPNIQNRFGYQENVYNLGNVIATPAVYESGAWTVEPYVDIGDAFYTDVSNYKVKINVPEGYKVAATGMETDGVYIANDVRDFAFCASDGFKTLSDAQDGVALCVYYSARLEKTATQTMDTAKKSLELFNALLGGYPYESLNFVVNNLAGSVNGMEYPGFIMLAPDISVEEFEQMGFAEDSDDVKMAIDDSNRATCHEIAHQWFYGIVGNNQIVSPWLDEGMCRYMEYVYEKKYPPYAPNEGYPPMEDRIKAEISLLAADGGVIDGMEYAPDTTNLNWSLYDWESKSPMEYGNVYMKGAALIYQMEREIGEEAFAESLKEYVATFAYDHVTSDKFMEFWNAKGDFTDLFALYFQTY